MLLGNKKLSINYEYVSCDFIIVDIGTPFYCEYILVPLYHRY